MLRARLMSLLICSSACLLSSSSPILAEEQDPREAVRYILLRNLHPGDPSHARQLSNLGSKGPGIEKIELILIEYVQERCPIQSQDSKDRTLCRRSISSLGDLD